MFTDAKWRQGKRFITFAVVLVGFLAFIRLSEAQDASSVLSNVALKLQDGNFSEARAELNKRLEVPEGIESTDLAKMYFYHALADQQESKTVEGEDRKLLVDSSGEYYSRALEILPSWSPALNNLAQVRIAQGRFDAVPGLFESALNGSDKHQSFYATNYAEFLFDRGQGDEAVKYLERASRAEPGSPAAHRRIVNYYRENGQSAPLRAYLWRLVQRSNVAAAQETALELLEQRDSDVASVNEELLAIIVYGLSRRQVAWAGSSIARRLTNIGAAPDLELPITEITELVTQKSFRPADYTWWTSREFDASRDPDHGMWSKDAFAALITSLGNRERHDERFDVAEKYYRLSIEFVSGDLDPDALLALAEMFDSRNQPAKLEQMMRDYEFPAFMAKNDAYRGSRIERIYRFHRSLGIMYTRLRRWGSSSDPASAIFQLERAIRVVDQYNENYSEDGRTLDVEPQLVSLLAEAYAANGQNAKAVNARLAHARTFVDAGDLAAASYLVRDAEAQEDLPDDALASIASLRTEIHNLERNEPFERFAVGEIRSAGPITFGPDGVLFVGDPMGAEIVAIQTNDTHGDPSATRHELTDLGGRISAKLNTSRDDILINDMAVNPASGNVYLSVAHGRGPDSRAVLMRVNGNEIEPIDIDSSILTRTKLSNPPPMDGNQQFGLRSSSITDLRYIDGNVYVSGLSSDEFASRITAIPYPFGKEAENPGTSVEIYHGAHGRFETHSPVRTFAPYDIAGERNLLCAYSGTPLVKFSLESLKPGENVRGTTVAELGNRNRPLDMFVYEKNGQEYVLMANSNRGVMKISTDGIAHSEGITQRVQGTAGGVDYDTIAELSGVFHFDRLNRNHAVMLVATAEGTIDLKTIILP